MRANGKASDAPPGNRAVVGGLARGNERSASAAAAPERLHAKARRRKELALARSSFYSPLAEVAARCTWLAQGRSWRGSVGAALPFLVTSA